MIWKILKKDLSKKKTIKAAVFLFIMLSALLMSSGINIIIELNNSLNYLFEKASPPHFVQAHSGELDKAKLEEWSGKNEHVKELQISELLTIQGSKIYIDENKSEVDSVMDLSFVYQNPKFDYLLNLDNEKIKLNQGEVAVPIYYLKRNGLEIGDKIYIKDDNAQVEFVIKDFVRDAQMNPSIISSKRFLVTEGDYYKLKSKFGEIEYQIGYKLNSLDNLREFRQAYSNADLPEKGPSLDSQLFKIANAITDGSIAVIVILISLLLNIIALLCLRFIIILTIEEDYKEIGVMKGIGIPLRDIKRIYLSKYVFLTLAGIVSGYIASLFLNTVFSKNIMLYIGKAPKSIIEITLPILATIIIGFLVIGFCMIIFRRFNKISAVEAIRMSDRNSNASNKSFLSIYKVKFPSTPIFLGIRDIIVRFKVYILLFLVFILSSSIVIVPINFLNTIKSPSFITYMGVGKSDIILDLRQSDNIIEEFEKITNYIQNDKDVVKFAPYITSQYEMLLEDGLKENLLIETGDFTVFPLDYLEGFAPELPNEIALSYLNASQMEKKVGDSIKILIDGKIREMIIAGIYQDITDGGKTAKANIKPDYKTAAWYTINIDVNGDILEKVKEYDSEFDNVKVTDPEDYFSQTFSNSIDQLTSLVITGIVISILVTILITSLFLQTLVAKDRSQIAIKKSIGITLENIKLEYITKALGILTIGIVMGTIVSNTMGEKLVSALFSIMGAAEINFNINILTAYVILPLFMIAIVVTTTLISIGSIKNISIADINAE